MSFAERQLAKFGWKNGDGLGKNNDGIKKSISVTKKNDTKGLGGKLDKWDFAWWDHVFNKSASNIQVNKDESGEVKVEKQKPSEIQVSRMGIISTSRPAGPSRSATSTAPSSPAPSSTSTMSSMVPRDEYTDDGDEKPAAPVAKAGPSWLFGFVKASASSAAAEEAKKTNKDFTNSADSFAARAGADYEALKAAEGDEYRDYCIKVSDKELFEACEGRTARKGARGEQPGKIGRVTKELLLDDDSEKSRSASPSSSASSSSKEKKKKSKKEEKKSKADKKGSKEKKKKSGKKEKSPKKVGKEKSEKKEAKEKKEKKEKKDKESSSTETKDKKSKKESKVKDEMKKSKKRSADEDEARPDKKSKKSKKE
ncbi:G patch domain-containing protein 4 [Mortierella polycephala]|uniref:G patch domain-containing protein 4 n=1 Tax=Mortierella polycephala TaxID=41804 RepID=A0A9P6U104_9FUNG|nr:G patch domain-containing protein 4 [Mortierella polycephala]